jgi:hypothetical protein
MAEERRYTLGELSAELRRFEADLKAAGLRSASIETYIGRSKYFLRWLAGDYNPSGPR